MDAPQLVAPVPDALDRDVRHRSLALLATIATSGSLQPRLRPGARSGYAYESPSGDLDPAGIATELAFLYDAHYLERRLVERLTLCPACDSVHLNFREICPACARIDIEAVELLQHYRCGYVAPAATYPIDGKGRRCPKCHGRFHERGSDHDSPGPQFVCKACAATFQTPLIGAVCLACSHQVHGDALDGVGTVDIAAWTITSLGRDALAGATSPLAEPADPVFAEDGLLYRRPVFLALLEDELQRRREIGSAFSLVSIPFPATAGRSEQIATLRRILAGRSDTAKAVRIDARTLAVLLPLTSPKAARDVVREIARDFALPATVREIGDGLSPRAGALAGLEPLVEASPA